VLFGSFVGAVDAGPASSPYPRSRHAAQHHVTLPTSDPNGIVNFDDAIVVIESDGQQSVAAGEDPSATVRAGLASWSCDTAAGSGAHCGDGVA